MVKSKPSLLRRALGYFKRKVQARRRFNEERKLKGSAVLPLKYFHGTLNVGDVLNVYLTEAISGRTVRRVETDAVPHVLGVGSIMHFGSPNSWVWGSGVIDPNQPFDYAQLTASQICAVRGHKTLALLREKGLEVGDVPLGDPAILMPEIYRPEQAEPRYDVGIVAHYVDEELETVQALAGKLNARLISVRQHPEAFINELIECRTILSSSLHGLILADSYAIPNLWVRFSDKVLGGDFKFLDYYSTTSAVTPKAYEVYSLNDVEQLVQQLRDKVAVNHYQGTTSELRAALPLQK